MLYLTCLIVIVVSLAALLHSNTGEELLLYLAIILVGFLVLFLA